MTTHGFELVQERNIAEINSQAQLWRHVQTGAELLSVCNDDENKVFGITFRTPPSDSTGLPHIIEHAVLAGSRKYPVKEPFVELLKGSLKTFLNAMTFPDKTCYPVASQNLKDFYNLVDVYLDAVFYPLNTPHVLAQEGWHYELEDLDGPLTFKGVVFNEMKGAYSSPDSVLARYSQQSLFPDNTYGVDSGGDPAKIPDLTHEQFLNFHQTYYHPSNSRIFFYGDDDPQERLRLLDVYLRDFSAIDPGSDIPLQPRFEQPRALTYPYGVAQDEDAGKGFLTMNWMLTESSDPTTTLSLGILSHILIGSSASPLRKALIDSGLGEDLTGGGLDSDLRQMMFSAGLKGIALEDSDKVENLILQTLQTLAQEGIDPNMIEASVNTIEFRLRENNTGYYPRGLLVLLRAMVPWLYGGDPLAPLAFETPLAAIKERLQAGEPFFENLIRQHLLQNSHRATVILEPDPGLNQRQEAAEAERLAQARAAMSQEQLQDVIENARQLKLLQETPDSPEALATIPTLQLADLDKHNKHIPLEALQENGTQVLYHDLFTNGIVYLDVGFDLHALPQELLPYVPLFGRSLVSIGTEKEDFVTLLQRIGSKTGGIGPSTLTSAIQDSPQEGIAWLFLQAKSTMARGDDLLAILRDVLLTVKLDNQERFKQMVLETKARKEARLVPGGHGYINTRLRANFGQAGWASEQMGGISSLFFVRQLAQEVEENWPAVLEKLERIRSLLLQRGNVICNVTLDGANWQEFRPRLAAFLSTLPDAPTSLAQWTPQPRPAYEGLTIPAQVNYVGKAANLYDLGYQLHGSISVISNYLRTTWLWERVRVRGGAYGGYFIFNRRSGVLSYLSYRDPNLLSTLDSYDQTAEFLRQLELSEDELLKSIIGAIGDLDAYQLPDAKGYSSLVRYLAGDTDDMRQRLREQILSTTVDDFKALADVLERVGQEGQVAVLGSQDAIEAANVEREGWLEVQKVL